MTSHMGETPARAVLEARALTALAAPIRFALLTHLMDVGARTASQCAPVVGASASNCSWHLRALAAAGLVERVGTSAGGGDARQRPWRATSDALDLSGAQSPAAAVAARAVDTAFSEREENLLTRHRSEYAGLSLQWQQASGLHHASLVLTATELQELLVAVEQLLAPYRRSSRRKIPRGALLTSLSMRAFPHPER